MPWLEARYLYHHAKLYIADERAAVVTSADFSHHGLIRCEPGTPRAPFDQYPEPDEFDAWIERTRETWARDNGVDDPSRLQIVCAMALVPGKQR